MLARGRCQNQNWFYVRKTKGGRSGCWGGNKYHDPWLLSLLPLLPETQLSCDLTGPHRALSCLLGSVLSVTVVGPVTRVSESFCRTRLARHHLPAPGALQKVAPERRPSEVLIPALPGVWTRPTRKSALGKSHCEDMHISALYFSVSCPAASFLQILSIPLSPFCLSSIARAFSCPALHRRARWCGAGQWPRPIPMWDESSTGGSKQVGVEEVPQELTPPLPHIRSLIGGAGGVGLRPESGLSL